MIIYKDKVYQNRLELKLAIGTANYNREYRKRNLIFLTEEEYKEKYKQD